MTEKAGGETVKGEFETPGMSALVILPEGIAWQREHGWPDIHPEEWCHHCGTRNVWSWFVESDLWNQVAEPGEILCPQCFTERWALLHGAATWRLELIG